MATETREREVLRRLAEIAPLREAGRAEVIARLAQVDLEVLADEMQRERALGVLGPRLAGMIELPDWFRERIEARVSAQRATGRALELAGLQVEGALMRARIDVAALKGPGLAHGLYGDLGARSSGDLDLLVAPADFHRACDVLAGIGWQRPEDPVWRDGLPLFEASLRPRLPGYPPIDLHWRIDWHEERFSADLLARHVARTADLGAIEGLGELLVYWARDGFAGLRTGIDVAAWWDRFGAGAAPGALDDLIERYPALGPTFATGALVAERTVGLPAGTLMPRAAAEYRGATAARLIPCAPQGSRRAFHVQVVTVDWLLSRKAGRRRVVARHFFPPVSVIADVYGFDAGSRVRGLLGRARYALVVGWQVARGTPAVLRGLADPVG